MILTASDQPLQLSREGHAPSLELFGWSETTEGLSATAFMVIVDTPAGTALLEVGSSSSERFVTEFDLSVEADALSWNSIQLRRLPDAT